MAAADLVASPCTQLWALLLPDLGQSWPHTLPHGQTATPHTRAASSACQQQGMCGWARGVHPRHVSAGDACKVQKHGGIALGTLEAVDVVGTATSTAFVEDAPWADVSAGGACQGRAAARAQGHRGAALGAQVVAGGGARHHPRLLRPLLHHLPPLHGRRVPAPGVTT